MSLLETCASCRVFTFNDWRAVPYRPTLGGEDNARVTTPAHGADGDARGPLEDLTYKNRERRKKLSMLETSETGRVLHSVVRGCCFIVLPRGCRLRAGSHRRSGVMPRPRQSGSSDEPLAEVLAKR